MSVNPRQEVRDRALKSLQQKIDLQEKEWAGGKSRTESPISPEKGDATKAPPTSVAPTQKEMQGPTSEPKSPGVDESQQCLSEIGIEQKSDNPAEHAEEGWENIEDLVLDPGMFPRAELNVEHVTHLQERIEAGDHIPTIGVTRPDLKIITGAHRHEALKLVSKKVRMGQLKTDSLGYPMNAEGTKIRLRYVVIPDGVDAMIYCYQQNTTHGLRPSPSDTKRVVESYYRTHQGCSAQFFAEQLKISQKAAENYVRDARTAWKTKRDRLIRDLSAAGRTQQEIAETLQVSQALVSQALSQTSEEREERKGQLPRGGTQPTPVPKGGQSTQVSDGPEAGNKAPERNDHRDEPVKAPSSFCWDMNRLGYGDPNESVEIRINGLGSLNSDQYDAIKKAVGQLEKICQDIDSKIGTSNSLGKGEDQPAGSPSPSLMKNGTRFQGHALRPTSP